MFAICTCKTGLQMSSQMISRLSVKVFMLNGIFCSLEVVVLAVLEVSFYSKNIQMHKFICAMLNDRRANSCSYHRAPVSVTIWNKDKAISSHFITYCSQTNWVSTLHLKTASNWSVCHYLSPPPPFLGNVRESACLLSLEGAPPLTSLSVRCLPIHYSYLAWPVTNMQRGDYWRTRQEVSFKQASIKALYTTQHARGSSCLRGPFSQGNSWGYFTVAVLCPLHVTGKDGSACR